MASGGLSLLFRNCVLDLIAQSVQLVTMRADPSDQSHEQMYCASIRFTDVVMMYRGMLLQDYEWLYIVGGEVAKGALFAL